MRWKYSAGAGLLKRRRGLALSLFNFFSRFIIFTFRNYFALCQIVLCIWRKTIVLWKKSVILSCLKMNLKISLKVILKIKNRFLIFVLNPLIMSKEGWFVGLGQVKVAWGWGKCLKYLKSRWNRKDRKRNRFWKRVGASGSRAGCHKKGGLYVVHATCFSSL